MVTIRDIHHHIDIILTDPAMQHLAFPGRGGEVRNYLILNQLSQISPSDIICWLFSRDKLQDKAAG